ncbi:uncharacterized protein LOC131844402 isoform X2 [Achroia grisella]|uniref:uncharacterized protein LOC131844402 isoform X2 n=1 Tax=Achroia grisella TaxID=688607 RepID=UPI0027D2D8C4|nr:uncharacterized protein LOC131844402 isoform X2 [Achroia grisella]
MTTEIEGLKTNEFLRRRKLRLQQVREQSKDIAKKIRLRAKAEKLQNIADIDTNLQKQYLQRQEKLVKKLEDLYSKGIKSVGTSHKNATEVTLLESPEKIDLSKQRGREAAAELRRKKQEKLDEQQKLLNRKAQAREIANEISRDKSTAVVNKLLTKPTIGTDGIKGPELSGPVNSNQHINITDNDKASEELLKQSDMATQWDFDTVPNEWEPNIPRLSLPKDDRDSTKESLNNNAESKSDKSKKHDLFALSEEMPLSLRGGPANISEERLPVKPSLTLVSEYLKHRGLNLRDTDSGSVAKKQSNDLTGIKQTILRTRASNAGAKGKTSEKTTTTSSIPSILAKKNSVTVYNHSTRNTRDVPLSDEGLVVPTCPPGEDAYSLAAKESNKDNNQDMEHLKRLQDMRSKIAMTKQNVEKEYKDTMMFLNSLPKNKGSRQNNVAYMDGHRQEMLNKCRQQKLQHEFRKIEKECRKHSNMNSSSQLLERERSKSKSPSGKRDNFEAKEFQYSWMPVPESDGNLVIHTIPTSVREGKAGNTVKFSKVDSYHEYRSRHKHTPPTKDTVQQDKQKKVLETVIIENSSESTDSSSIASDTSSVENLRLNTTDSKTKADRNQTLTDTDRIIIYKVLNSKKKHKAKKKAKLISDIAKSLSALNIDVNSKADDDKTKDNNEKNTVTNKQIEKKSSLEHLQEGVYKTTKETGDNITSLYFTDNSQGTIQREDNTRNNQLCACGKQLANDQKQHQDTDVHKEVGNKVQQSSISPNICADYKCGCPRSTKPTDNQPIQPSTANSTTSFKTAVNDKANTVLPDSEFMKLIDDCGQDAGKLYIGATGFLKNDAYEVIIQLRKKESMKDDNIKSDEKVSDEKTLPFEQQTQQINEEFPITSSEMIHDNQQSTNVNCLENLTSTIPPCVENNTILDNVSKTKEDKIETRIGIEGNSEKDITSSEGSSDPSLGVHTSCQKSSTVPNQVSKLGTVPKPATSACTQTTFSSPNSRPVFFHMSSSTSTAYMSPPENVLPQYFRHHRDDIYDSQFPDTGCTKHEGYPCKHCAHSRKQMQVGDHFHCKGKRKCSRNKLNTSPITFRSYTATENKEDINNDKHTYNKNRKCHKCESRTEAKTCSKSGSHKKFKQHTAHKKPSQNLIMHISSGASSYKNVISKNSLNKDTRSSLNPIIKSYVNKLLTLNKQGMKAIEVVNQECSAVTTPGSSIIDMPNNIVGHKPLIENKISLEQIKSTLIQQILNGNAINSQIEPNNKVLLNTTNHNMKFKKKSCPHLVKKRLVHKVKSLNISRNVLKNKSNQPSSLDKLNKPVLRQWPTETKEMSRVLMKTHINSHSKLSKQLLTNEAEQINCNSERTDESSNNLPKVRDKGNLYENNIIGATKAKINQFKHASHRTNSANSEMSGSSCMTQPPMNTSTQTNQDIDSEIHYIKLAQNKLENMEKIADLTEKCTQRLSNLAKVLDEVRKNKSTAYSQISSSDSASDSDQKANKINTNIDSEQIQIQSYEPVIEIQNKLENKSPPPISLNTDKTDAEFNSADFVPFLLDIPKPAESKRHITPPENNLELPIVQEQIIKNRTRPPPALNRINLKHTEEYVTPHELSTVVEVDSPMSVKFKNLSRNDTKCDAINVSEHNYNKERTKDVVKDNKCTYNIDKIRNPDVVQIDDKMSKRTLKLSSTETSEDYKNQIIDLKKFNDIMLKPFISIHEYAKQCNVGSFDEASNLDDVPKDEALNDELSSMQSDGSLPDVIAELLKRNIISEPFKYDSNANSTTVSSESTLSVFALSKMRKEKKRTKVVIQNKENIAETSDTLSFSSNPDLENAFKKLGMGWASSTLKKTKERLALSSSSNTSSSSLSQFKLRSLNQHDTPALVTDSVSSILDVSKKPLQVQYVKEKAKNAGQQTSLTKSMTVKEFLTNELANKITFTNRSNRNDTEEFVSLFETKMPEELKQSPCVGQEELSVDSATNGNRARTSTPVQIFKSMTYHSSSSSNLSNGLFSNVDDLSSVKVTSNSIRNHSTSEKDDLTIPNCSLRTKKSDASKSE